MARRDSALAWSPVVARYLGYSGVLFVAVVWLLTNRIEPALIGLFGSLIAGGEGADALREFSQTRARTPRDEE